MDMQSALDKLAHDYPDVQFKEFPTFQGPAQTYGMSADGPNFHFVVSGQPSPMCLYRRLAMCCQAMK